MKKITQQPEISRDIIARDDIFSQVMGEDRHGHVHTYGLGPSPSDIWGSRHNQFEYQRMAAEASRAAAEEVRRVKEQMQDMQQTFESTCESMKQAYLLLQAKMAEMRSSTQNRQGPDASSAPETPSSQPGLHSSSSRMIPSHQGRREVLLMSSQMPTTNMARGLVVNDEPSTKIGVVELGPNFWEIYIEVPLMLNEPLVRLCGRFKTIGDAIGASIAWPSVQVKLRDDV